MATTILEAQDIRKAYRTVTALAGVSVEVREGEFVALVGPSGCGKTTLLKIVGGFEELDAGAVRIADKSMIGIPPAARPTSMVFQKLALFPHKTVRENIGFALKLRRESSETIAEKTRTVMEVVHLPETYLDRYPNQLSGGEQQRVALARSMIADPSLLLLDEPLTALDVTLKKSLQGELKRLHRELGVTFLHVTHDLEEAMMLADRICVMRSGRILQTGTPTDIYYRPENDFVAGFIGDINLFPITVRDATGTEIHYDPGPVDGANQLPRSAGSSRLDRGAARMMVRPELIRVLDTDAMAPYMVTVRVEEMFMKGASIQYQMRTVTGDLPVVAEIAGTSSPPCDVGDTVRVGWDPIDVFIFPEEESTDE